MNETLRKQMEEMAKYFEAPYCSASHNCSNPYQAFEAGFTACSEIYEKELSALKEEKRKLREALEQCSCECVYLDIRKCARCNALADSSGGSTLNLS